MTDCIPLTIVVTKSRIYRFDRSGRFLKLILDSPNLPMIRRDFCGRPPFKQQYFVIYSVNFISWIRRNKASRLWSVLSNTEWSHLLLSFRFWQNVLRCMKSLTFYLMWFFLSLYLSSEQFTVFYQFASFNSQKALEWSVNSFRSRNFVNNSTSCMTFSRKLWRLESLSTIYNCFSLHFISFNFIYFI